MSRSAESGIPMPKWKDLSTTLDSLLGALASNNNRGERITDSEISWRIDSSFRTTEQTIRQAWRCDSTNYLPHHHAWSPGMLSPKVNAYPARPWIVLVDSEVVHQLFFWRFLSTSR
jgi:hypothetical protein